jgi:hypothetical protein
MNFETLGTAAALVSGWIVVVLICFLALELTWMLAKRIVGMARILKAIATLNRIDK